MFFGSMIVATSISQAGLPVFVRFASAAANDSATSIDGYVADISPTGCRVELKDPIIVGRYLKLDIVGMPPVAGWVACQEGNSHWVDFVCPLGEQAST